MVHGRTFVRPVPIIGDTEMIKYYKVYKDRVEVFKTTSEDIARKYRDDHGGVIKKGRWIIE